MTAMPSVVDLTRSPPPKRPRVLIDLTISPPPSPPLSPRDPLSAIPPPQISIRGSISADCAACTPDVAWLLHVKSRALAAGTTAAPRSTDTSVLPSTLSTAFFVSPHMPAADLAALSHDMTLARSVGFLPYSSPDACVAAIRQFSRAKRQPPPPPPPTNLPASAGYNYYAPTTTATANGFNNTAPANNIHNHNANDDAWVERVRAPLLSEDWYPGTSWYIKLRGAYLERNPAVRGLCGADGFLTESWDGEWEYTYRHDDNW